MSILEDIRAFVPGCEQEQRDREAMLRFLAAHEDAFLRTNLTAHMTASAWVLSRDRRRVVMVYHNLYRSWSWTGGHADGGRDLLAVAMREVTEETGLRRLAPVVEGIFSLECRWWWSFDNEIVRRTGTPCGLPALIFSTGGELPR